MKYLAVVFVLVNFGWAEGEWVVQDNPCNGNQNVVFSDASAIDSLHCWVVGSWDLSLLVLRTSDGGKNWEAKGLDGQNVYSSQTSLNWLIGPGIKFIDTLRGWICVGKTLFTTRDGGGTWVDTFLMDPYSNVVFTDIEFVDSLNGWIVSEGFGGGLPLILHSSDGGRNWEIQDSLSAECDLRGVCFLDSLKGFVVGDSGTLFRTTDGGEHWIKIETGTAKDLMDVQFADSLHGLAVGDLVLKTEDGGATWEKIEGAGGYDVAFPNYTNAWTSGFWFSANGGAAWEWKDPGPGIPAVGYNGISFPDTSHGWVVGEYGTIVHYGPKTGIEETNITKPLVNLLQIYPNPFSKTTKISSENRAVSSEGIKLNIYDVAGKLVKSFPLAPRCSLLATTITWDGKNDSGQRIPAGIYFCQLEINGQPVVREKLVIMH